MKNIKKIVSLALLVALVGCGETNNSSKVSSSTSNDSTTSTVTPSTSIPSSSTNTITPSISTSSTSTSTPSVGTSSSSTSTSTPNASTSSSSTSTPIPNENHYTVEVISIEGAGNQYRISWTDDSYAVTQAPINEDCSVSSDTTFANLAVSVLNVDEKFVEVNIVTTSAPETRSTSVILHTENNDYKLTFNVQANEYVGYDMEMIECSHSDAPDDPVIDPTPDTPIENEYFSVNCGTVAGAANQYTISWTSVDYKITREVTKEDCSVSIGAVALVEYFTLSDTNAVFNIHTGAEADRTLFIVLHTASGDFKLSLFVVGGAFDHYTIEAVECSHSETPEVPEEPVVETGVNLLAFDGSVGDNAGAGGQDYAVADPSKIHIWYDQGWCGSTLAVTHTYENDALTINTELSSGSCWYGLQVFGTIPNLTAGTEYEVSVVLNSTVEGEITFCGNVVDIVVGENVLSTKVTGVVGTAPLNIQFGVDGGDSTINDNMLTATYVLSNMSVMIPGETIVEPDPVEPNPDIPEVTPGETVNLSLVFDKYDPYYDMNLVAINYDTTVIATDANYYDYGTSGVGGTITDFSIVVELNGTAVTNLSNISFNSNNSQQLKFYGVAVNTGDLLEVEVQFVYNGVTYTGSLSYTAA